MADPIGSTGVLAGPIEVDTDFPGGPFHWDAGQQRWVSERRADVATVLHPTHHGPCAEIYYRQRGIWCVFEAVRPRVWRSLSGGTPADTVTQALLNAQLALQERTAQ